MQATALLSAEHRIIEQVIAALDAGADRLDAGEPVRAAFFTDATRFLRDFADGYHHGKEEGVLFEALAERGMPLDDGPVGVMLYEHDRARDITAKLGAAAERLAGGAATAAVDVAHYARQYGELLVSHIYKEDNILFAMAARALDDEAVDAVLDGYARVEAAQAGRGSKADLVALARALCAEMGVDEHTPARREAALPCHAY